jgi:hypothetical protein
MFYHDEFDIGHVVSSRPEIIGALSPGGDYERQKPAEHSSRIPLPEDG